MLFRTVGSCHLPRFISETQRRSVSWNTPRNCKDGAWVSLAVRVAYRQAPWACGEGAVRWMGVSLREPRRLRGWVPVHPRNILLLKKRFHSSVLWDVPFPLEPPPFCDSMNGIESASEAWDKSCRRVFSLSRRGWVPHPPPLPADSEKPALPLTLTLILTRNPTLILSPILTERT